MKPFVLLFLFVAGIKISFSQNATITIKAGEDASVLYKHIYTYPQFTYGKVYFNDGSVAGSKMNFNLLLEAMQFISEKGDTLALANENTIKVITIGQDNFYFREGYLQLVSAYGDTELAVREKIKFLDEKNIGAYGMPTSTHTIDNYNTLRANNTHALKINKDMVYAKEKKYYFSTGKQEFSIANRKTLLKEFRGKKTAVENYLKEHAIDFDNGEDLKNLFTYLAAH